MINHRVKGLGNQDVGLREANTTGDLFRQLFCQVTMQTVFRPQHFTTRRHGGRNLHQRILFIISDAQYALARHQRPGVALAGWAREQTLRTGLRLFAILLAQRAQFRAFFCPFRQRVQRLRNQGFDLRIDRVFGILSRQGNAQRVLWTVRQQTVQIQRTTGFRARSG
ncbi:hypothetical protein D3C78_750570 [compost metagenome]